MMTQNKRTIKIIIISVIMNLLFFSTTYFLKLPLWLDTTGTIYASLLLYFPAGFLVGLINNTILAVFFYSFSSIFYYLISVAVAYTTSFCIKKYKVINIKFLLILSTYIFFVSIALGIPLTFVINQGIPSDYWGRYLYNMFCDIKISTQISTILSVSIVKIFDVFFTITLVSLIYRLTPITLKDDKHIVMDTIEYKEDFIKNED